MEYVIKTACYPNAYKIMPRNNETQNYYPSRALAERAMKQSRYEIRSCTTSIDHGQSVDGKVYNNFQAAQHAADAWESQYGEDCYVHVIEDTPSTSNPFADCNCVRSIRGGYTCMNCKLKMLKNTTPP